MIATKPVVLLFTGHYLPGFKAGGILRTIVNTVDHLKEFDFKIVTTDRDLGDDVPYESVCINEWNTIGNAEVYYLSVEKGSKAKIKELIKTTKHDILHLNSFFDPVFTIQIMLMNRRHHLIEKPIIVSPRGEFNATQIKFKFHKKKIFIAVARLFKLYRNVIWHASDGEEANDIKKCLQIEKGSIRLAQDLPKLFSELVGKEYEPNEELIKIIFLSRISKEKNLKYAIEILQEVKCKIAFDIYGPIEEIDYWNDCKTEMLRIPEHIKINYCGPVNPDDVSKTMNAYDIFFLPTFAENYGHVIVEALLVGLPVLISDGTPWRHLSAQGFGWDINLKERYKFIEAIEEFSKIELKQKTENRIKRKAKFKTQFSEANAKKENYDLYQNLLNANNNEASDPK